MIVVGRIVWLFLNQASSTNHVSWPLFSMASFPFIGFPKRTASQLSFSFVGALVGDTCLAFCEWWKSLTIHLFMHVYISIHEGPISNGASYIPKCRYNYIYTYMCESHVQLLSASVSVHINMLYMIHQQKAGYI